MDKLLGAETHSSVGKLEKTMQETERIIEEALKTGQTSRTIEAINSAPKSKYAQTTELLKAIQDPSYKQPEIAAERSDVHQADMLEEEERRDAARYRYERLYWESIPEAGKVSVSFCFVCDGLITSLLGTCYAWYPATRQAAGRDEEEGSRDQD